MGSLAFVSGESESRVKGKYGLGKHVVPVKGCRTVGKKDMRLNDAMPAITVNPETYAVHADGERLTCEPAKVLPLAQKYHLF
jgi:urease alpha subunit